MNTHFCACERARACDSLSGEVEKQDSCNVIYSSDQLMFTLFKKSKRFFNRSKKTLGKCWITWWAWNFVMETLSSCFYTVENAEWKCLNCRCYRSSLTCIYVWAFLAIYHFSDLCHNGVKWKCLFLCKYVSVVTNEW